MQASKPSSSFTKAHFFGAAGDADGAAAQRSWRVWPTTWPTAPDAADTTTVSPGLRLADLEQAEVGRHAWHAEHAVGRGDRRERWIDLAQRRRRRWHIPASPAGPRRCRRPSSRGWFDFTTSPTVPPVITSPMPDRRRVGRGIAHAPAHVGIERHVDDAHQHLARPRLGHRRLPRCESPLRPAPPGGRRASTTRRWVLGIMARSRLDSRQILAPSARPVERQAP